MKIPVAGLAGGPPMIFCTSAWSMPLASAWRTPRSSVGGTTVLSMMKAKVGWPMTPVWLSTSWKPEPPEPEKLVIVLGSADSIMSTPPDRRVDSRWPVSGMGLKVIESR